MNWNLVKIIFINIIIYAFLIDGCIDRRFLCIIPA